MNSKDFFALDTLTMKRHLTPENMKQYLTIKALRSIGINETYITILQDTYTGTYRQSSLRRNTSSKRRKAGRHNFPQIIHSNNLGAI